MATFLTNSRMNPALAARVEASVRGHKGNASLVRRIVAVARVVLVLTVAFGIYSAVAGRRRERSELERRRADLLGAVQAQSAGLGTENRDAVARAESWLARLSGAYEGDLVPDALRSPGALSALLARPAVYVRGPIDSFQGPAQIEATAAASSKDALLFCLMDPPASRVESVLLEKVRVAYGSSGVIEERTENVRRLHDAVVGLPFLLPPWSERVRTTEDAAELTRLRRELERAPIERAKQAASAHLFVIAIDEPGDGKGPTELDGERSHDIRLAIVDVPSAKVLLRMRSHVDPSWISPAKRPTHASRLDGCAFAFDVHQWLRKTRP